MNDQIGDAFHFLHSNAVAAGKKQAKMEKENEEIKTMRLNYTLLAKRMDTMETVQRQALKQVEEINRLIASIADNLGMNLEDKDGKE